MNVNEGDLKNENSDLFTYHWIHFCFDDSNILLILLDDKNHLHVLDIFFFQNNLFLRYFHALDTLYLLIVLDDNNRVIICRAFVNIIRDY